MITRLMLALSRVRKLRRELEAPWRQIALTRGLHLEPGKGSIALRMSRSDAAGTLSCIAATWIAQRMTAMWPRRIIVKLELPTPLRAAWIPEARAAVLATVSDHGWGLTSSRFASRLGWLPARVRLAPIASGVLGAGDARTLSDPDRALLTQWVGQRHAFVYEQTVVVTWRLRDPSAPGLDAAVDAVERLAALAR